MNNWAGKRLGQVQIESLVARGGVAEVYVGTHLGLERKVAVKILRNLNDDNSDALLRFQREARVVAKLRHPNIVQIHDFDTIENDPYLVMEYIEGPSLSQYLRSLHQRNERLPISHVMRLMDAITGALQYAHNQGVIHRDVKPGNILLTSSSGPIVIGKPLPEDFEPILTDFGLVRFLDANRATTTGHITGTPAYMSPEQARGEATDGRTDVYSLGIVLYEILAGHIPFDGESTISILLKQVNEPPPPIPGLSPLIESVLNRALVKDAKDRFRTPTDFATAFRTAVNMSSNHPTVESHALPSELPTLKTEQPVNPRPRWVSIILPVILAIALSSFFFINNLPVAPVETITPTVPSVTHTIPVPTNTSTQTAPLPLGPTGILRFQNAAAITDQVSLMAQAMPAPPPGTRYEFWLIGKEERISLGTFSPDQTGQGQLIFSEPEGLNLFALYNRAEVTIEPRSDTDPQTSGLVAYAFTFPPEGVTHLRYLLSSFPSTPEKIALILGLYTNIQQIEDLAQEMQASLESRNKNDIGQKAEIALNILVGAKSADYKDWNGDGLTEPKASYGLLLNGSNFGYIQAVYAEADYTVNTPNATQYMLANGEVVKTCAQNLTLWVPQVRDLLLTILTSENEAEIGQSIDDLASLADQMLDGIDLDSNGKIDILRGECGARTAYQYAYYMADMPLLPVSISYQLTAVVEVTQIVVMPTKTRSSFQNGGSAVNTPGSAPASQPAEKPKPTKKPNPTKQPGPGPGPDPTKKPKDKP